MTEPDAGFEILEHTADVGVRSWGPSLEEAFRQSTLGLLDIIGVWRPGPGERIEIEVEGRDPGALLVDWLSEVLYLQEVRDPVITAVGVSSVQEGRAAGWIELAARSGDIEGTAVKAITFHQLDVSSTDQGWSTTVFVDI